MSSSGVDAHHGGCVLSAQVAPDFVPGVGYKVVAARLLYGRNAKSLSQHKVIRATPEVDQEHEELSRSVIKQINALLELMPELGAASSCPALEHQGCGCAQDLGQQVLRIAEPWLVCGTKDCGHVIASVAKQLFEYALQGLQFGVTSAWIVKLIHDAQVTKLRQAKDCTSRPHSIRRLILNLVQQQFYSRPAAGCPKGLSEEEASEQHHQCSINNIMFIGQLLLNDLLIDSAIHESLAELLQPRHRRDTLPHRLEMACRLLFVAGQRLDQGVCMDPYYIHMERLIQGHGDDVGTAVKQLFANIVAQRVAWLEPGEDGPPPHFAGAVQA